MICDAPIITDDAIIPVMYDLKIRFLGLLLCKLAILKGLSSEIGLAERVASFKRCLLKGEAPGFATGFYHPFSFERPFKCQRHLIQELECDN